MANPKNPSKHLTAVPAKSPQTTPAGENKARTKTLGPSAKEPAVSAPSDAEPMLKKQELIAKVVERCDVKKKDAKPIIEDVLAVLGEALAEGRELNLQPFGKLMHKRNKDGPNARIIVAKIRQAKPGKKRDEATKEPVAEPPEGS